MVLQPCKEGDTDVLFVARKATDTCALHSEQLWVAMITTSHDTKKLPWALGAMLTYGYADMDSRSRLCGLEDQKRTFEGSKTYPTQGQEKEDKKGALWE